MSFRQHSARLLYFIRWTSNYLHASKDVSAGRPDPELHEYIVSAMRKDVEDSDKRRRLFSGKRKTDVCENIEINNI